MPENQSGPGSDATHTCLLATPSPSEVRVMNHVVAGMGLRVQICADLWECLDQIKRFVPAVVLVEAGSPALDIPRLLRIVSRYPATSATAVVLLAPAGASDRTRQLLASYESFGVLDRPLTCQSIRATVQSALAYYEEVKATVQPAQRSNTSLVPGCNSLLARTVQCPFHPYGVETTAYALRAGKIYVETDIFDLPIYRQAAPGNDFIDFHRVEPIVCPECFFTSVNPAHFESPDQPVATTLDEVTREAIADDTARRERILLGRLTGNVDTLLGYERSLKEMMALYDLAIASSQTLYEAAPLRHADELIRIGNYELSRAAVLASAKPPEADPAQAEEEALKYRQAAIPWLCRGFDKARSALIYQAAYQLLALQIYFGDDAAAFGHLTALKDLTRRSWRELDEPALLDRYLRRAQGLWSDRERHRLLKKAA